jgi:hypothetical protein
VTGVHSPFVLAPSRLRIISQDPISFTAISGSSLLDEFRLPCSTAIVACIQAAFIPGQGVRLADVARDRSPSSNADCASKKAVWGLLDRISLAREAVYDIEKVCEKECGELRLIVLPTEDLVLRCALQASTFMQSVSFSPVASFAHMSFVVSSHPLFPSLPTRPELRLGRVSFDRWQRWQILEAPQLRMASLKIMGRLWRRDRLCEERRTVLKKTEQ